MSTPDKVLTPCPSCGAKLAAPLAGRSAACLLCRGRHPLDKPLLILDLDETLIYATSKAMDIAPDFSVGPYAVYKRPFLDAFLDLTAVEFHVAVWSSSTADYVAAITSRIIPSNISRRFEWSRSRCVQRDDSNWQDSYWIKDLKKVAKLGYA